MNYKHIFYTLIIPFFTALGMEQPQRAPIKLPNVGNSCFMNAPVQALLSLEDLSTLLVEYKDMYEPVSFSGQYIKLAEHNLQQKNINLDELQTFCMLGWRTIGAPPQSQQDAGEFLQKALEHLTGKDMKSSFFYSFPRNQSQQPITEISELFSLKLSSQILSPLESYTGEKRIVSYYTLQLPLPTENTLYQELSKFFAPEEIEYSPYGIPFKETFKVARIEELKKYIIINLKRITYDIKKGTLERNKKPIIFPVQELDFNKYFSEGSRAPGLYNLKAFILHSGTAEGGHYIAYVRYGKNWYKCDDSTITSVNESVITTIAKQGYEKDETVVPTAFIYEQASPSLTASKREPSYAQPLYQPPVYRAPSVQQPVSKPITQPMSLTRQPSVSPYTQLQPLYQPTAQAAPFGRPTTVPYLQQPITKPVTQPVPSTSPYYAQPQPSYQPPVQATPFGRPITVPSVQQPIFMPTAQQQVAPQRQSSLSSYGQPQPRYQPPAQAIPSVQESLSRPTTRPTQTITIGGITIPLPWESSEKTSVKKNG